MPGTVRVSLGLAGAVAGAGITLLARLALGMPAWKLAPLLVIGILSGAFVYLAAVLGLKKLMSIDGVRGALCGLAGTAAGILIMVLVRYFIGLPAWNASPVLTVGVFTGVITYLAVLGVFNYWIRWAIGDVPREEGRPRKTGRVRYFNVDTNHKVIGVQYLVAGLVFLPFAVTLQLLVLLR